MQYFIQLPALFVLSASATALAASAQGIIPLDDEYAFGVLEGEWDDECAAGVDTTTAGSATGSVQFQPDGTLAFTSDAYVVCAGGTVLTTNESGPGTYVLDGDGKLTLDLDPTMPGTDLTELRVRFDQDLAIWGDNTIAAPQTGIALRKPTDATDATLSGQYAIAGLRMEEVAGGFRGFGTGGSIDFDGAGGFSGSVSEHVVDPFSSSDVSGPVAGTYSVAADGTVLLTESGDTVTGAVLGSGEIFFLVDRTATEVGLTIGVRKGGGHSPSVVLGDWRSSSFGITPGFSGILPELFSTHLDVAIGAPDTFASSGVIVFSQPVVGQSSAPFADSGTFTLQPNGRIDAVSTVTGESELGWLSETETFAMLANVTSSQFIELELLLSRCSLAVPYGSGTPGSGDVVPVLSSSSGFPRIGSTAVLDVDSGLGGAPALLALSTMPVAGLPLLGGTIWADPLSAITTAGTTLGGTPGAPGAGSASIAIPISPDPGLKGLDVYSQAFVIDAGSPGGLVSMTQGLALEICE